MWRSQIQSLTGLKRLENLPLMINPPMCALFETLFSERLLSLTYCKHAGFEKLSVAGDRWSTMRFCETTKGLNALLLIPLCAKQIGKLEKLKNLSLHSSLCASLFYFG